MTTKNVEIKFKLPKSILVVMGSTETAIEQRVIETVVVDLYRRRQISLEKAAEIVNIPIWQINQILAEHDVGLDYNADDAAQDWNTLREVLKT